MLANTSDSLGERILRYALERPDRRAVACDAEALTYLELVGRAKRVAGRLQALGVVAGGTRRVGVLAANSLDYAVIAVACQLAGVTLVPLPALITVDAQARMIADSDIAFLFHDLDHREAAHAASRAAGPESLVQLVAIEPVPHPQTRRDVELEDWLDDEDAVFTQISIDPQAIADLIYSSGTTGLPKGISQSYAARRSQCVSLEALGVTDGVRLLQTVGLYSNFGLSALLLSLWWGGTFFMQRKFSGEATVELLANEKIDMAWFAPATLIRTLETPGFRTSVSGKTCAKLCAGAPLSEAHKIQVLRAWPGPFFDVYGQTETGTLTVLAMHRAPPSKLSSVGAILPTAAVRIITEAGAEVRDGEEGEIVGHSATLMTGYHQRADADASAFWRDETGRVFVRTGDIGRLDEDGYLWLCDRKKDMIISGGFNIYPADIERVFADHPDVFETAVVGYPSDRWGESPVAFVTLRSGAALQEDELRTWVNGRLGSVQRVAMVKVLSELPNGVMGKILKRKLRDEYAQVIGRLP